MTRNANIKPTPADKLESEAKAAEALRENPMLVKCLDDIEDMYTHEWKRTEGPHDDMRERAYYMVRAIDRLRQHINEYVSNGHINPSRVKDTMKGK